MNIHFTDKKLFNDLNNNTIVKIKVGSHMYGLNNSDSDDDFLSIYLESDENRNSFMWEHHQLQFKENDIDFNFTSLQTFIRNALTGDATINFEVLFSNELKNSELNWLWEKRFNFINYNIIKSYLGLAKRDLKFWKRDSSNGIKNNTDNNKKLSHFVRGIIFAKNLIENNFSLELKNTKTFNILTYNDFELIDRIKNGTLDYSFSMLSDYFESLMNNLRDLLNDTLNQRKIVTYMKTDSLKELDSLNKKFINNYKNTLCTLNYDNLFYETMENGVSY